jgi:LytS/YehU family sensor histidine kinase
MISNAFLGAVAWFSLSPLPWQWTGDHRPMAPGKRGLLQSLGFSLMLNSIFMTVGLLLVRSQLGELRRQLPGIHEGWLLAAGALLNIPIQSAVGFAFALWEKRKAEKAEALKQAEEARWTLLKAQMSPHVLLNSLNGLAELVRDDTEAAIKGMRDLAEIYNQLLGLGEAPLVPLSQERALLERYLAVEKLRLGERLEVTWDWDSALDSLEAMPLLLQPLVENAIKHGVAADPRGGTIHISGKYERSKLLLVVANTGSAPMPSARTGTGVGIRNLKSRLEMAYKGKATFALVKESPWMKAELSLPMENR